MVLHSVISACKKQGMSLRSPCLYVILEETVRVARATFPTETLEMQVYDALGPLFTNAQSAALFLPPISPQKIRPA